jgi:hypothetical protein
VLLSKLGIVANLKKRIEDLESKKVKEIKYKNKLNDFPLSVKAEI